jgi:hypothetical protein
MHGRKSCFPLIFKKITCCYTHAFVHDPCVGVQVRDNVASGVLEPAMSKTKMIQFATEAAITILRIDDLITLAPSAEGGED